MTMNNSHERRSLIRRAASSLYRRVRPPLPITGFFRPPDEARKITPDGELAELFFAKTGRPVNKWTHYHEHYERHFARFRGTPFKMLEIGVFQGGSLELWRNYFGSAATIFGIDINPDCANRVDAPNQVRIGSQDDPAFLRAVAEEMGGLDLVLDDGSHNGSHIINSFRTLFPLLSDGGLYVIEDIHADFGEWPGQYFNQTLSFVQRLIFDMHHHFSQLPVRESDAIGTITIADSMLFIEKKVGHRTANTMVPPGA